MRPIIVIAPWSSGSTAVAGFLHHCGAYTCPPHHHTNDNLTPNSYEPLRYGKALRELFDEFTLQKKGSVEKFEHFFEEFYSHESEIAQSLGFQTVALKHPLQTFILPYLNTFLRPVYVLVTRPLNKIEATRRRRNWHSVYGESGARQIYKAAMDFFVDNSCPYLALPYNALREDVSARRHLLEFCDLSPTNDMLIKGSDFVRR